MLEALSSAWKWFKGFVKYTVETNFNGWYDVAFFVILIGAFVVALFTFSAGSYMKGYTDGDYAGAKRGWAGATTFYDSK